MAASPPGPADTSEISRLRAENAQLRTLLAALPDISFVLDRHGRYVQVLGGSDRAMYSDGKTLEGHTLDEVLPPGTAAHFREVVARALDSGELQTIEYPLRVADVAALPDAERGSERGQADQWFQGRVLPLPDMDHPEPCVLWVAINITERRHLEEDLRRLATTDELTGAANRRTILARARQEMARCRRYRRPLTLIMLDVDNFKVTNDTYGHATGDEVLRLVAATCQDQLRQSDAFGRAGGEEFLAVLPETGAEGAAPIGERLVQAMHDLGLGPDLPELAVRVSAGGARMAPGDSLDTLMGRADDAMYAAKEAGRDRFVLAADD